MTIIHAQVLLVRSATVPAVPASEWQMTPGLFVGAWFLFHKAAGKTNSI
jgi:hypothetical protein